MKKFRSAILFLFVVSFFILFPVKSWAFQIDKMSDVSVIGDFVLNETKTEVQLNPGENNTRSISLTNRSGVDLFFSVSVEDFSASTKEGQNIDLLGAQSGAYSLKDYLKPEVTDFILHHGEKIILPVAINIPENAQPGALYGAVIFSAKLTSEENVEAGNIQSIPRLASLFFVRVNGEALESGELLDFGSPKTFYLNGPIDLEFNYKNSGNVYLNPYGELKITDIFGREVYTKWISPYYVMPQAIRQQKEIFERHGAWGLYQATLRLNRGYGNYLDQKSIYFFIFPIQYILGFIIFVIILIWLTWRIKLSFKKS